jgi:hypothetical protein
VPGRAGTAGRDSGPSTARFLYRAGPGTIKRAVLQASPLGMTHLTIYTYTFLCPGVSLPSHAAFPASDAPPPMHAL